MGKHIALIRVSGVITGGGSSSDFFGGSTSGSEDIIDQLERARKNDRAKAIIIRIDSPGGSAAASEEVWNEIMRVRKSKPVYTSMGDVAASGGYYIASACDRIFADYNTLTGSIGVIFSLADMSELYRKIGYRPEVVKSGKYKDIGSAARPLTPDERALLQGMIDSVYDKFLTSVAEGRRMKIEKIKPVADGRLFTGNQALKLKLVDEIGGLRDATRAAARRVGITGEPELVEYRRKGLFDMLMSSSSEATANRLQEEAARRMAEEILRRGRDIEGIR
jgi:protease-4